MPKHNTPHNLHKKGRILHAQRVYLSYKTRKLRRKVLSGALVGVAAVLIAIPYAYWHFTYFSNISDDTPVLSAQETTMAEASVMIYRHSYAYPYYCLQNGYKMRHYPHIFEDKYAELITLLEYQLHKKSTSLPQVLDEIHRQYGPSFSYVIEQELYQLYANLPPVSQNRPDYDMACAGIDENAEELINKNPALHRLPELKHLLKSY